MVWRMSGGIAAGLFGVAAVLRGVGPDPALWVVLYAAAAATGITIASGRSVARWVNVILVVMPAEMALVALLFEPEWALQTAAEQGAAGVLTRGAAVDAMGMIAVATWSAVLAVMRPHGQRWAEPLR